MTLQSSVIHDGYFHLLDNFVCFLQAKSSLGNKPVLWIVILNEIRFRASDERTLTSDVYISVRDNIFSKQLLANSQEMQREEWCNIQSVNTFPLLLCKLVPLSMWKYHVNELTLTIWFNWHARLPTVAHKLGFMEHFSKSVKLSNFSRQEFVEANPNAQFTMWVETLKSWWSVRPAATGCYLLENCEDMCDSKTAFSLFKIYCCLKKKFIPSAWTLCHLNVWQPIN